MRIVLLALGLLVTAPAAAQYPDRDVTAIINDSIERGNRRREAERQYDQMRQDYIEDTKQAMREYDMERQLLKEPEPFDITLPGMGKKRRNYDDED